MYEISFLTVLIFTIITESIILFFLIKKIFKEPIDLILIVFTGFIASFSTLPYLWFLLPVFISNYFLYTILGEFLVFLIEAIIYFFILKISFKKALIVSLACNLVSFVLGLIIF